MPRIEVEAIAGTGHTASIKLDGRELHDCRAVNLRVAVDAIVTAEIEVFASERLHFEGDAAAYVSIVAMPGFQVIETTCADGSKVYHAEALA